MIVTGLRFAKGNRLFPQEIIVDDYGVTIKKRGLLTSEEISIEFKKISTIEIDSNILGISNLKLGRTTKTYITAEGFDEKDLIVVRNLIQLKKTKK